MKQVVAYHGSNSNFDTFDSRYIGTTGTHEGFGFYFTTNKDITKSFGNIIYTCELTINKLISNSKKTIKLAQLKKIVLHVNKLTDGVLLSNYGDVEYEGINNVLSEALRSIYDSSDTDTEIFGDMVNSCGSYDDVANAFVAIGYNAMIEDNPDWGGNQKVIVMFNANDIKILDKSKNVLSESFVSIDMYDYAIKKGWV